MDEKRKIKMHKLIQEVEKKKKSITDKSIKNYIELKKAEGQTVSYPEIKNKVSEKIHKKEYDSEQEKEADLRKQNKLLDEVLSADSQMRIGALLVKGIGVIVAIWIVGWIFSPSEKKERHKSYSHTTRTHSIPDDVDNARKICDSLDNTGVLTKPCELSTGFYDLSIEMTANLTPAQARLICKKYAQKSLGVSGWNLKIYSPFSNGNTIAQCKLK